MMPPLRFAVTREGLRIAFQALGRGPAVMMVFPYHVNHLRLNWQVPLHRGAFEFLARYFKVINLDFRGAGLSAREVKHVSGETFAQDIEAVLDELHVERVVFCAMGDGGLAACEFTHRHPGRVAGLVFVQGGESEANRRILNLRHVNAGVEAKMRGALIGGVDDRNNASALAAVARHALDGEALASWEQMLARKDRLSVTRGLLAPALWVHAADDELVGLAAAQALARSMPNANLLSVPGESGMAVWRDRSALLAIARFIARGFGIEPDVMRAQRKQRGCGFHLRPAGLSEREAEVLRLLAAGRTNQCIAEELFISLNTVSYHLRNIFAKTGTDNRTEAASFAHRHGLAS